MIVGHLDAVYVLNTLFILVTVEKASPLFTDCEALLMNCSVVSVKAFLGDSVYAASKATLYAFARGWLNELIGLNIRVNMLHPGPIATPMQNQVLTAEA